MMNAWIDGDLQMDDYTDEMMITINYQLPTTHNQLLTTHYSLPTPHYQLLTIKYYSLLLTDLAIVREELLPLEEDS